MKKTIAVIIKQKNFSLGPQYSIQSVALGYAFNYLIPNNIVEIANKGKIKHIKMLEEIQSKKASTIYNSNLETKTNLEKIQKISTRKKVGHNQYIFGRITEQEIIEQIFRFTGEKLDKKQIKIPNIKEIGSHKVYIKIEDNMNTEIRLQILPRTF